MLRGQGPANGSVELGGTVEGGDSDGNAEMLAAWLIAGPGHEMHSIKMGIGRGIVNTPPYRGL
jgi:hypothetical protein